MERNLEGIQNLINLVFPGLQMFVRDVNLSEEIASKYIPGTFLHERGFTDASCRIGGMETTHRIAILSNHMRDLRHFENGTNWGMFTALHGSHFKVLDVYEINDKTQILLLHLPDDIRWKVFRNIQIEEEKNIIEDSRKRFEEKIKIESIKELQTEEWKKRTSFPIGIDDDGNLFDLEYVLQNFTRKINESDFRDITWDLIFIKLKENVLNELKKFMDYKEGYDGVLAYGYIDPKLGISYKLLKLGKLEGHKLETGVWNKKEDNVITKRQLADSVFLSTRYLDYEIEEYIDYIVSLEKEYNNIGEKRLQMRKFGFLDPYRHQDFPDDVVAATSGSHHGHEHLWLKCWDYDEKHLYGKLMNDPSGDYGMKKGDIVEFYPMSHGDHGHLIVKLDEQK